MHCFDVYGLVLNFILVVNPHLDLRCDPPWFGHECTPHLIHWELASRLNGPGDLFGLWQLALIKVELDY